MISGAPSVRFGLRRRVPGAMQTAIWRREDDEWRPLLPSSFPSEEKLHDLVQGAPNLLPLSGDPTLTVLGREVPLGSGYADLLAVEPDGRLVIVEIKLRRNAEARRAVVAQILTYAAYLKGLTAAELADLARSQLQRTDATSIAELVARGDQSGEFDRQSFADGMTESLAAGAFRLVLVLDEAPSELVQLVGYLESVTSGITLDLITVASYTAGIEEILVPHRVDPDYEPESTLAAGPTPRRQRRAAREIDGCEGFEESISRAPSGDQSALEALLAWARHLEEQQLATLKTVFGDDRMILLVWVPGQKGGLASVWNDNGAYISLWRSVFVRLAWNHIAEIENLISGPIGQGNTVRDPSRELLDALTEAYRDARAGTQTWNQRDFYVSFGENPSRSWDDAREFGFVSAGGGEWYSRSLRSLRPGHRVFAYIPRSSGVGGYVGVGDVIGEPVMAKNFVVRRGDQEVPYLDVARAVGAGEQLEDASLAEWIVPVAWIATRGPEDAIRDSDFFANQNSAVKLTHGYTLERLTRDFGLDAERHEPS